MATPAIEATELAGSVPAKLSIWHMISNADVVVMLVMLMLFLMSVWVWAMVIDKSLRLRRLNARATRFEEAFWSGGSLEELFERIGNRPRDPMSAIFAAAMREWRRSSQKGLTATESMRIGLQQRIDRVMTVTLGRELEGVESFMTMLASISSAAPFIGLFGTVWGIMNSFTAIAGAQNTSLAVVAPGIAEALFATALGLFAAVPAAVGYNKLSAEIGRYGSRLENFTNEFATILSRQLEEKAA